MAIFRCFMYLSIITLFLHIIDGKKQKQRKQHLESLPSKTEKTVEIPIKSTSVEISTKITLSLDTITIGKSKLLDYKNEHHLFVVAKPEKDVWVSAAMLTDNGWEPELNNFFDHLVKTYTSAMNIKKRKLRVIDVGANFGAFSLHVASQHISVDSFEMQPFVVSCLKMSKKLNVYNHWNIFHAALYDVNGKNVTFQPLTGNYG
jgi:2-polyprenyl-3-methyl-5-hydroxy-6-metoxy-1,4-benzoquinol methylase